MRRAAPPPEAALFSWNRRCWKHRRRAIRYVRDNFFAGRTVTNVEALNIQAEEWCRGIAADRRCPGQEAITAGEAFAEEAPRLLPLPDHPYPLLEQVAVKAGKTPYIRFGLNDYSIPHTQVRHWLTVLADPAEVRVTDGHQVIARHRRRRVPLFS